MDTLLQQSPHSKVVESPYPGPEGGWSKGKSILHQGKLSVTWQDSLPDTSQISVQKSGVRDLSVKFNGDPTKLSFFITNVRNYTSEFGNSFPNDASHISVIATKLKDCVADWYMQLYESDSSVLTNLEDFLWELKAHFEDPLAKECTKKALS